MIAFGLKLFVLALLSSLYLAYNGIKKKNLTKAGAITGFFVGFFHVITGLRGYLLFFFYLIGSKATKYKKSTKEKYDSTATATTGNDDVTARGARQVLACSVISAVLSLIHALMYGNERMISFRQEDDSFITAASLSCGIIAHHATCLGDTLASELGMVFGTSSVPILITQPFKSVPHGTNGGITLWGTLWSLFGGTMIGILLVITDIISGLYVPFSSAGDIDQHHYYWCQVLLYSSACGFIGSMIDSILGALLQVSYYDIEKKCIYHSNNIPSSSSLLSLKHISGINLLSNEQVNFVSIILTCIIGGVILGPLIFV